MKNQATVYNQQTFEIVKVRINRIMTVDALRSKIASQFDTEPDNLVIKVGSYETKFDGSKPKDEVKLQLFKDLKFNEDQLIGVTMK